MLPNATFNPSDNFKPDEKRVVSPANGYVSLIDNSPSQITEGAVELLNYDIQPDGNRKRPAYDLYEDIASRVPAQYSDYKITALTEKTFTDKTTGTSTKCLIFALYKTGKKTKIFINHFYNPQIKNGIDWNNRWDARNIESRKYWVKNEFINLTERYKTPITNEEPADETAHFTWIAPPLGGPLFIRFYRKFQ